MQLLLQSPHNTIVFALRTHLGGSKSTNALPSSVHPPLQTSESTNHDDTSRQSSHKEITGTHFSGKLGKTLVCVFFVSFQRHQIVHWLCCNGAKDSGPVSTCECDGKLGCRIKIILFLACALFNFFVDFVLCGIKAHKLDHCVRNLSSPQWLKTPEWEPGFGFACVHLAKRLHHAVGDGSFFSWQNHLHLDLWQERGHKLFSAKSLSCFNFWLMPQSTYLCHLEWTQKYISNNFCRSAGNRPQQHLFGCRIQLVGASN